MPSAESRTERSAALNERCDWRSTSTVPGRECSETLKEGEPPLRAHSEVDNSRL